MEILIDIQRSNFIREWRFGVVVGEGGNIGLKQALCVKERWELSIFCYLYNFCDSKLLKGSHHHSNLRCDTLLFCSRACESNEAIVISREANFEFSKIEQRVNFWFSLPVYRYRPDVSSRAQLASNNIES